MDGLHQLEILITLFVQNLGSWLVPIMKVFTAMGQVEFYMLIIPLLYWCIDSRLGFQVAAILLINNYVNVTLKLVFHLPRPYWIDLRVKALVGESSFGMPSGHAQNAASILGLIHSFTNDRLLKPVLIITIFLIGFSRIALGVHFTSDVIVGWIIGIVILYLFMRCRRPVLAWFLKQKLFQQILYAFLSSILAIAFAYLLDISLSSWKQPETWVELAKTEYPSITINPLSLSDVVTAAGMWFGIIAGAAWFYQRYGIFNSSGTAGQKGLRYLLGLTGIAILFWGVGLIFPGGESFLSHLLRFIRLGSVGLWVTGVAPIVFTRINLARPQVKAAPIFDGK